MTRFPKIIAMITMLAVAGNIFAAEGTGSGNPGAGRVDGLSGVGTRAAEFLTIPVGPRAVAMGGAYTALADEISAIYWNPAGLAFLDKSEAFFTVIDRPLDISYTYGAFATPIWEDRLVIGAFLSVLNSGDQEVTTETQPEGTGEFYSAYSLSAGAALAYNFSDRFSAGIVIKDVHEDIWGITQDAIAFDMGTNYHETVHGIPVRLAFSITNLGTNLKFSGDRLNVDVEPDDIYPGEDIGRLDRQGALSTNSFKLPTSFRIAGSANVWNNELYNAIAAFELSENSNQPVSIGVGGELTRKVAREGMAAFRAGWAVQQDEVDITGGDRLRGLSLGGGFIYNLYKMTIRVDYAYRNLGILSSNHAYSLSISF